MPRSSNKRDITTQLIPKMKKALFIAQASSIPICAAKSKDPSGFSGAGELHHIQRLSSQRDAASVGNGFGLIPHFNRDTGLHDSLETTFTQDTVEEHEVALFIFHNQNSLLTTIAVNTMRRVAGTWEPWPTILTGLPDCHHTRRRTTVRGSPWWRAIRDGGAWSSGRPSPTITRILTCGGLYRQDAQSCSAEIFPILTFSDIRSYFHHVDHSTSIGCGRTGRWDIGTIFTWYKAELARDRCA